MDCILKKHYCVNIRKYVHFVLIIKTKYTKLKHFQGVICKYLDTILSKLKSTKLKKKTVFQLNTDFEFLLQ